MKKSLAVVVIVLIGISALLLERLLFHNDVREKPFYISYILSFTVYAFFAGIAYHFFRQLNPFLIFSLLFLPELLVFLLVLFDKELHFRIPSVFPVSTILVFSGILFGYLLTQKYFKRMLLLFVCILLFIWGHYAYVTIPFLIKESEISINSQEKKIVNTSLRDIDNKFFDLRVAESKIIFFEFWFKECLPCWEKMQTLNKLKAKFKDDTTVIFITVNAGKIDPFNDFKSEVGKETYKGYINLYDSAGVYGKQFGLEGYPTDVIIYRGEVLRVFNGWTLDVTGVYLTETEKILKTKTK